MSSLIRVKASRSRPALIVSELKRQAPRSDDVVTTSKSKKKNEVENANGSDSDDESDNDNKNENDDERISINQEREGRSYSEYGENKVERLIS